MTGLRMGPMTTPPTDFTNMTGDEIVNALVEWFFENFEDPAHSTPRDEGEFVYIWGGPYDAEDQLGDTFAGIVDDEYIAAAIDEVQLTCPTLVVQPLC
ncbi:MAG: hypothetical protein HWE30_15705 [Methylocystaceae bacterium]|nr:hypothetical protein [Methylocystaceae bacterium]